ncbi:replicative DNA helicase [Weissella diestrammenae]|uniref:Replicative DNA helicase n=1 Tax=Weissella diestrammenae TaxID=1162633 RepID=A0A7G9T6G4_9LACO|nr:replicative DNA helicase [Weissella diestrammenae]MCM0583260.1 replicative DNA helicase [Weissella diestrammenae]QNN75689.1 replicative DNA helicase [Weissella diestrammenae]
MADELVDFKSAPQDGFAEQAVLGSILISTDPIDTLSTVSSIIAPNDFFQTRNRLVYQAMLALDDAGRPIDPLVLQDQLNSMNQLENSGGASYLAELGLVVPIASNAATYAAIVKEKAQRRALLDVLAGGTEAGYTDMEPVGDLIARMSGELDSIDTETGDADFQEIAQVVNESFEQIERNSRTSEKVTGVASGFRELDELTTGFHAGEMIIVAARPAVGKTAFVLNVAQKVAVANKKLPVVIFSLEMPAVSLVNRMLASEGNINSQNMRTGSLTDEEWRKLTVAMASLSGTKIYIDDTAGIKITEIRSKLRRLKKQEGELGLVIIDYLQLVEGTTNESQQQAVSSVSRNIKKMAMELQVPIIALAQLSRGVEQRQDKRPVLSDIRDSGSIEQDADIVGFLYREDYYRQEDDGEGSGAGQQDEDGPIEIILEKNRSGARGTAKMLFQKAYSKFSNYDYVHSEDDNPFA